MRARVQAAARRERELFPITADLPGRGALLAALRYRLATERAAADDETKAALEQIEGEVRGMV